MRMLIGNSWPKVAACHMQPQTQLAFFSTSRTRLVRWVLTPRSARCTLRVVAQLAGEEVASDRDDTDEVED